MKAKYISPETVVVELEANQSLLAGSMNVFTGEVPQTEVLSPGLPTLEDPFDILDQFDLDK